MQTNLKKPPVIFFAYERVKVKRGKVFNLSSYLFIFLDLSGR